MSSSSNTERQFFRSLSMSKLQRKTPAPATHIDGDILRWNPGNSLAYVAEVSTKQDKPTTWTAQLGKDLGVESYFFHIIETQSDEITELTKEIKELAERLYYLRSVEFVTIRTADTTKTLVSPKARAFTAQEWTAWDASKSPW